MNLLDRLYSLQPRMKNRVVIHDISSRETYLFKQQHSLASFQQCASH